MPNLQKTARIILLLYSGFAALGALLYWLCGMSLFDAVTHSMCSLSTGGFSSKPSNIGEYNSIAIEAITIFLMLIGTTNFAVLLLLTKGKWRQALRVSEMRFMLALLLAAIPLIAWSLVREAGMSGTAAFRLAAFNTVSALSTTGYSTLAFDSLPPFALGIFILLMLIGGGAGSTAGGLKISRVYMLMQIAAHNLKRRLSPTRQVDSPHYTRTQGKTSIDASSVSETASFALAYMAVFITGTLILTVSAGCSLTEAGFEFASALGTAGISIGVTSASSGAATLVTLIAGMILGRLEIFIVLIGFYSGWRLSRESIAKGLKHFAFKKASRS